ncbi:MAG: polyphenol oxidase family protein, partial [Candidatus Methylumidiphilus sp.]
MSLCCITPDWPAPPGVRAYSTLRSGGHSLGVHASLNLGVHVGDQPEHVAANRQTLRDALNLPNEPFWLNQVHGTAVAEVGRQTSQAPQADAAFTHTAGAVCVVMTADCLPVLFASRDGQRVAAAHAGWRGLADGVLAATVEALGGGDLMAWLGPAI